MKLILIYHLLFNHFAQHLCYMCLPRVIEPATFIINTCQTELQRFTNIQDSLEFTSIQVFQHLTRASYLKYIYYISLSET